MNKRLSLFCAVSSVSAMAAVLTVLAHAQDKPGEIPKEITNSIGMKLVLIPSGEFLMGSPAGEKDRLDDEVPQHKVKITKAFYMGATEVTQKQWVSLMDASSGISSWHDKGDTLPVNKVGWEGAQEFLKQLSEKEGKQYRLPTEAEWEYACRAGSVTKYCFGDDEAKLGQYACYKDRLNSKACPVGERKANAWGLYDMHGNVWEWCQDFYDAYPKDTVTDPTGPATGVYRVWRGGSYGALPPICRSALRGGANVVDSSKSYLRVGIGLRVVMSVPDAP
ncbi:MAG: formylglycine-generating enzyme family protein [Verrucomicrobiota bacterium]